MVTIEISQTWLYLIFGAVLSAVIIPIILLLVWPWRRIKRRMESMEKESTDLRNQIDKYRREISSWREELQKSLETIETIEKRVEIVAEKIGLKGDLLAWGRLIFLDGKLDEAIASFSELLDSEPSNDTAHFYRGLCYLQKGRQYSKDAVEELKIAVEANKEDPDRHLALSRAYLQAGFPNEAKIEAETALNLGITNRLEAKVIIGNAYLAMEDHDKAISVFKECPLTHTPAVIGWGQALIAKARQASLEEKDRIYTEIINLYDQAIELNPVVSDYYAFRAQAYAERDRADDWEKALEDWEEAKVRAPRNTRPGELKGDALYQRAVNLPPGPQRNTILKEALKEYGEALVRAAELYKPTIRNKRSRVYQLLSQFSSALSEAKAGANENPNYVINFMAYATAAISAFEWKEVIRAATSGLELAERIKSRGGIIWCLLFRIIGRCGDHQGSEYILGDCKLLADELGNFRDFDPAVWDWSVAKERLKQAMQDWSMDITPFACDSIALVEKGLSLSQYRAKYGI